jgi:hypothetical protein
MQILYTKVVLGVCVCMSKAQGPRPKYEYSCLKLVENTYIKFIFDALFAHWTHGWEVRAVLRACLISETT